MPAPWKADGAGVYLAHSVPLYTFLCEPLLCGGQVQWSPPSGCSTQQ